MKFGKFILNFLMLKANKKLTISQSIIWASAILVVAIVEEKQFATFLLVILATVLLINLNNQK